MKKIVVFFCGNILAILLFLLLSYFSLPLASPSLQNYYILKDHINQTTPKGKKRLLIMSASDGMFGIIGEMIDKETEYYPVNYSMFFGTGLDLEFRINKLMSILKKGDTILLPLNYGFYTINKNPQYFSYYQNMLSWGDSDFFYKHPLLTLQTLFKSPPSIIPTGFIKQLIAYIKKKKVIANAQDRWAKNLPLFNGVGIDSIDRYGELRWHNGTNFNKHIPYEYIKDDFYISPYFLEQYKKLKYFCDKNHIKIIVTYPPMAKNVKQKSFLEKAKKLKQKLIKQKIQICGNPENFQFDFFYFYDSPYHLNTEGAKKYTKELIKILNRS